MAGARWGLTAPAHEIPWWIKPPWLNVLCWLLSPNWAPGFPPEPLEINVPLMRSLLSHPGISQVRGVYASLTDLCCCICNNSLSTFPTAFSLKISFSVYCQHLFNEWGSSYRAEFSNKFVICFTFIRNFTRAGGASLEVRGMRRRPWDVPLILKATALGGCVTPGIYLISSTDPPACHS